MAVDTANFDVRVSLSTIVGQNRYDDELIEVGAGQRVALRFENTDALPHNVVILGRGAAKDSVGAMLNAYVSDSGATGRDFVPPRLVVIAQSPMVSPRQAATIVFTAPTQPGDYPFVCTVPGHWVTMWGVVRVR
jgi:plastocyanin